jgi:hypothetical protein
VDAGANLEAPIKAPQLSQAGVSRPVVPVGTTALFVAASVGKLDIMQILLGRCLLLL